MDHFNATVFNGSMVSTRRGFQVTKQKHKGLSFVNSSIKESELRKAGPPPAYSLPLGGGKTKFTFINNSDDEKRARRRQTATASPPRTTTTTTPRSSASPPARSTRTRGDTAAKRLSRNDRFKRQSSVSSTSSAGSCATAFTTQSSEDFSLPPPDTYHHQPYGPEGFAAAPEPRPTLPSWPSYDSSAAMLDAAGVRRPLFVDTSFATGGGVGGLAAMASLGGSGPLPSSHHHHHDDWFGSSHTGRFAEAAGDHLRYAAAAQHHHERYAQDFTTAHCEATLDALHEAIQCGQRDSPRLSSLTSQLCTVISQRLNQRDQGQASRNVTIYAVSTLAILSGYLGKHDHWRVHMQGLEQLIDMSGGQHNLDSVTIEMIRKADLCGACSGATTPSIPFLRRQVPPQPPSTMVDQGQITSGIYRHLSACGLDQRVINAVVDASVFNICLSLSRRSKGMYSLDEDVASDHFASIGYRLLSEPAELRQAYDQQQLLQASDDLMTPTTHHSNSNNSNNSNNMFARHHAGALAVGGNSLSQAIEASMRILTTMFVRQPFSDLPCGEETLFEQLESHVSTIISLRRRRGGAGSGSGSGSMIDPSLLLSAEAHDEYLQKPTLIWICLAGDLLSRNYRSFAAHHHHQHHIDAAIGRPTLYKELLREVLGALASSDPDAMVSEEDLEMCRLLDLGCLKLDQPWNERQAIRHILGVFKME